MDDVSPKEVSRTPPAPLRRALLIEAGHRCAIPTCRNASVLEFAHIIEWAVVKKHEFDNMIVLCAMCHGLYDREKKIDRKAIYAYKHNLAVLNGRYNDFERRLLETFEEKGLNASINLDYSSLTDITVRNLVKDGMVWVHTPSQQLEYEREGGKAFVSFTGPRRAESSTDYGERVGGYDGYRLTRKGKELVQRWFDAELIDNGNEPDPEPESVIIQPL